MKGFRIEIASVFDREKLIAEIWYSEKLIAEITNKKEHIEVEFFISSNLIVNYYDLMEILQTAKNMLLQD